jgi:hypothetical protein
MMNKNLNSLFYSLGMLIYFLIILPILISKNNCSITKPMYCNVEKLDVFFNETKNQYPIETLLNATDEGSSSGNKWLFDKNSLMIYNNKYWKGFFPTDQNFNAVRYFGGFWKRFYKKME